ncbi:DUF3087 family protein [Thalassotalea fusca]
MQIQQINKVQYRKRLNTIIVGFILIFGVLSVLYGALLIAMLSSVETQAVVNPNNGTEEASNFKFNLIGVVLGLITCAAVLHRLKLTPFFREVYYVWQIKQIQNLIYRKLKKIKSAAENNNRNAMVIVEFYYESLKQVYHLDDNTITMSTVEKEHQAFHDMVEAKGIEIKSTQFEKAMLDDF